VRHPEKCLVRDAPLDDVNATQQPLREMRTYNGSMSFAWRHGLLASGVGEPPRLWCEHRTRVLVTATHLEVIFALDELPIEIRLAGLDRDPRWGPAAGRFIELRFE
jgi:hypothetical protein